MKIFLASCVILDDYGKILLLHRASDNLAQWELPGGVVEEGETAEATAVREIDRELGVKVRLVNTLGYEEFESDEDSFHCTWFQAEVTAADPSLKATTAFDDMDYFDLEDLPSLSLSTSLQALFEKIFGGEIALGG
ncbi:MAG: NUDIX hydrolase [Candidatus Saccharimonadales bacterium]